MTIIIISGLVFIIWQLCCDLQDQKDKYTNLIKEIQNEELRKVAKVIKQKEATK